MPTGGGAGKGIPAMTRPQAEEWAAHSTLPGYFYHGTSYDRASAIEKEGFDLAHGGESTGYGHGAVWLSEDPKFAKEFAVMGGADPEHMNGATLEAKVNVSNVANERVFERIAMEGENAGHEIGNPDAEEYLVEHAKAEGYDAIHIPGETIVFDPKDIAVIQDSKTGWANQT